MKVYFVRHGHSTLNDHSRHQLPETPLSENGLKQASMLAHRFTQIPIDLILTMVDPFVKTVNRLNLD